MKFIELLVSTGWGAGASRVPFHWASATSIDLPEGLSDFSNLIGFHYVWTYKEKKKRTAVRFASFPSLCPIGYLKGL